MGLSFSWCLCDIQYLPRYYFYLLALSFKPIKSKLVDLNGRAIDAPSFVKGGNLPFVRLGCILVGFDEHGQASEDNADGDGKR